MKPRLPDDGLSNDGVGDDADDAEFFQGCVRRLGRPDALCRYVLKELSRMTRAGRASLLVVDAEREFLFPKAANGFNPDLVGRLPLGSGIAGRGGSLGRPIAGMGLRGGPRGYTGRAYVVLPLGRPSLPTGVACLTNFRADRMPTAREMRRLTRRVRVAGEAIDAARQLQTLQNEATFDDLTGLPRRPSFTRACNREFERSRRSGEVLGLAVVDIDKFKSINDRYGLRAGNEAIVQVAKRLRATFRDADLVARWGGDEFAVLLTNLGRGGSPGGASGVGSGGSPPTGTRGTCVEAVAVAERARQAVRARPVTLGPGLPTPTLTVSIGVAISSDAKSPEQLFELADKALKRVKRQGGDEVQGWFTPGP